MGKNVATNALPGRKGEKIVLAISLGFQDIFRIGHQNRPKLFALAIEFPEMLYGDVIEIDGHADAHGAIVSPINQNNSKQ